MIESGNDAVFNDSISKKSENALSEALMNYKDKISLKGEIIVNDTFLQKQIELENINKSLKKQKPKKNYKKNMYPAPARRKRVRHRT